MTKLRIHMDMKDFDTQDPISSLASLLSFQDDYDSLGVHEGADVWMVKSVVI